MWPALAYAESTDPSASNLLAVLGAAFIIASVAILASVFILMSRARRHPHVDLITAAAICWALIAAGSLLYAGESQMNWSKEYKLQLESGYLDPHDTTGAPTLPLKTWTALGITYAAMLAWSLSSIKSDPQTP
jgi:hypothetical protein